MRRSKTRWSKKDKKRASIIFFLLGVAIGLAIFVYVRIPSPLPSPQRGEGEVVYPLSKRESVSYIIPSPPKGERVRVRGQARVAIVLDDFGYNYKNVEAVFKIRRPVTFSILPHHPYSKVISRRVYEKGYEAILHLPLEPYKDDEDVRPEAGTITTRMESQEILDRLKTALDEVPYAKGVSNHQGSRATEDAALMQIILTEIKRKNLFFLDSLVTNKSVCKKVAKNVGIGFGRRSVFLDNKGDFEYIKGQAQQLIRKAKKSGSAIGIGHDREKTVSALSILMPEAEMEGVEFVFLSELIR